MSSVPLLDLMIFAFGLACALALVIVGILRVMKLGKALKGRLDAYAELPVLVYAKRASKKIEIATKSLARAPGLVYRANAAVRDARNSFAKIRTILTTPTSIWRLGELLITGE